MSPARWLGFLAVVSELTPWGSGCAGRQPSVGPVAPIAQEWELVANFALACEV